MSDDQVEFKLRVPERLRDRLAKAASDAGTSMNTEIVRRLENSFRVDEVFQEYEPQTV